MHVYISHLVLKIHNFEKLPLLLSSHINQIMFKIKMSDVQTGLIFTVHWPAILYGSETWTVCESAAQMIGSCDRKILGIIFAPVNVNGI
jgi:hypothetical protein